MRSAPILASLVLALGLFSFAEAANVYDQPSGSYVTNGTSTPSLAGTGVYSANFVAASTNLMRGGSVRFLNLSIGGTAFEACVYDASTAVQIACTDAIPVSGGASAQYTLPLNGSGNEGDRLIIGNTYRVVFISTTATDISMSWYSDTGGAMMITVADSDGLIPTPNWGALTSPPGVDFGPISSFSSSTPLFNSSSSLGAITANCAESGNLFSSALCRAAVFLFIPDPSILNQYVLLASTTMEKFPFSYVAGVGALIAVTHASSSQNMILLSINFASVDPASSTPFGSFLPNSTLFASSTILAYLSGPTWTFIKQMMTVSMWLAFLFYVWRELFKMLGHWHPADGM